ncbi:putative deoxyribonuclease I-like protein [Myxococcus xanthus DK 1622]|uniref:Deoxyribonuclease I-like protein n=1 Tax=Myxococcus xanthus (strain DK1622) TaxID=246197 RepID=Q1CXC1_MYXXD|nr:MULTISPECIES: deoxyribonuclease I [Myxococcus]ABF88112.1 putative deoxyribonuclease I-like protein [Myxococcus xanthus DK 1622]NOJ51300.1 deoxyribonuclease I [Myxococcus xanthus]QPM79131.1 deoxyribonuclease I [Myxococcus xanthus]QQR44021.1 deoxyribonuclease I [Myxococcus xanthus]QVW68209.1 deoxyribonuclease I [Myxococcus xanthus DZ2]
MGFPSFLLRVVVLAVLAVPTWAQAGSYLRVVSWNLRHEGWTAEQTYREDAEQIWRQYGANSNSNNGCDLVFLQEVMNASVVPAIVAELNAVSGVKWRYAQTPLIGRSSYKEIYAVLYREDTVSLLSSSVYEDTGDTFEREPQIVRVRHTPTGADYTFINWHTVWGNPSDRDAEVKQIGAVFKSVQDASRTDQDVILVGDHNMACTTASWANLVALSPTVECKLNVATTINLSGGYVNAYDHFWMQPEYVTEFSSAGRDYIGNTRDFVTRLADHAPIYLTLYSTSDTD